MDEHYDLIIVGAGIVAVAAAREILRGWPDCKMLMLEKEEAAGLHQTGHNSGVVHAGVYYAPGSLKARMCKEGNSETLDFCRRRDIEVRQCGKLIVASSVQELAGLKELQRRAQSNGLTPEYLDAATLRERERHVHGVAALEIKESAIVDYRVVCDALLSEVSDAGVVVRFGEEVLQLGETPKEVQVTTTEREYRSQYLLCCAGLMSDRLVRSMGLPCDFRILPFRGEFHRLAPRCENWFSRLVYPVPNPVLPFLGVHITPRIDGGVWVGPNALLGLGREAYRRRDVEWRGLLDMAVYPGTWRLFMRYWRAGAAELEHAFSKRRYLALLQRYCPDLQIDDLSDAPAGVRAQAINERGELLHDFKFIRSRRSLHVGNAPSPAATSALPIGRFIATELLRFKAA